MAQRKQPPIINIFCYGLPFDLSNQIFHEFESRFRDARYLIKTYDYYKPIRRKIQTVELLLALSIFHKRVIANLDAALKFYSTVNRLSQAKSILIGKYELGPAEKNAIESTLIQYRKLTAKFPLPANFFDYLETKELLKKIVNLKKQLG